MSNTGSISNRAASEKKPRLVLFDFDGTLTSGDSFGAFLWYSVSPGSLISGCFRLLFQLPGLLFALPKIRAERAKAAILHIYFGGKTRQALQEMGLRFYQNRLKTMLRPQLLETLRQYRDAGDTVVLVSASVDIWLQAFCDIERIALICTMLAYEQDVFRGAFATPNCNREEKARRIREAYDLHSFSTIIAYGNSSGDKAMFDLAQEVWFCSPNGLEKVF
jgi:phosphatidylglycerophosphatase C